jgi:hypothetical protein
LGECRRILGKLLKKTGLCPVQDWGKEVMAITETMEGKIQTVPAKQRSAILTKQEKAKPVNPITPTDARALVRGIRLLTTGELADVTLILQDRGHPCGEEECWVNLAEVSTETFAMVRSYVEEQLGKRAVPYPSGELE